MAEKSLQKSRPAKHDSSGAPQSIKGSSTRGHFRQGLVIGISESMTVGLSFLIGFLLQQRLNIHVEPPSYVSDSEVLLISVGMAFSYAFVFVLRRCHMASTRRGHRELISRLFVNISYAYLMELGLLFLIKDSNFALDKTAILFGYLIGIALLVTNGMVLIPALTAKKMREGKKRLIIKGQAINMIRPDRDRNESANSHGPRKKVEKERSIKIETKGEPQAPKRPGAGAVAHKNS